MGDDSGALTALVFLVLCFVPMSDTQNPKSQETKADESLLARLRAFVEKHGEKKALEQLTMSRQTLSRVMAGQSMRRGSLVLVQTQLDKLAPVDTSDATKGTDHGHE